MSQVPHFEPGGQLPNTFRHQGSLLMAMVGALVTAPIGAVIWILAFRYVPLIWGLAALMNGLLIGWAVRRMGQGTTRTFSAIGTVFAVISCIVGDFLRFVIANPGVPISQLLSSDGRLDELLHTVFVWFKLILYAIAAYEAYHLSISRAGRP